MVSVSANRERRTANRDFPGIFLIDAPTPDVSSTEIRRRLLADESISGMVPAAVERHILRHRLYSSRPDSLSADHLHGQSD
jgi:nicotinic acid mononucleotide adenylyltransferase